jgi:hypothetical protein
LPFFGVRSGGSDDGTRSTIARRFIHYSLKADENILLQLYGKVSVLMFLRYIARKWKRIKAKIRMKSCKQSQYWRLWQTNGRACWLTIEGYSNMSRGWSYHTTRDGL